jgi:hypothetical protein
MTTLKRNLTVNRDINEVFQIMYNDNQDIFKDIFNIISWEKNEWKIIRNKQKRTEIVYIYIEELPDELVTYLQEKDKYLKLEIKTKILTDIPGHKKIKTKFKMLNVNPMIRTILENLELVKMKNKVELISNNNQTNININAVARLYIPNTRSISQFMLDISEKMIQSLLDVLQST